MPPELKAKMQAGRERATAERQAREDAQLADFRAWLDMESATFRAYRSAREMYGVQDDRTTMAYEQWRAAMSLAPQLPPDSAFARERGE